MSHKQQIYDYLMTGASIEPLTTLNKFGCFALSQRMGELRRNDGIPIQTRLHHASNGKKWSVYWLEPSYIAGVRSGKVARYGTPPQGRGI